MQRIRAESFVFSPGHRDLLIAVAVAALADEDQCEVVALAVSILRKFLNTLSLLLWKLDGQYLCTASCIGKCDRHDAHSGLTSGIELPCQDAVGPLPVTVPVEVLLSLWDQHGRWPR